MYRQRRTNCSGRASQDEGLSLILTLAAVVAVGLWVLGLLMYTQQTSQSVAQTRLKLQALYNARMGVDTVMNLVRSDVTSSSLTSANGPSQLAGAVDSGLSKLSSPPFSVTFSVGSVSTTTSGSQTTYTLPIAIQSDGCASNATVSCSAGSGAAFTGLYVPASITETESSSGSTGGSTGGASPTGTISISPSTSTGANLEISGVGSTNIQTTGSQSGGSIQVNGSSATVTLPNLTTLSGSGVTRSRTTNGALWVEGTSDTVTRPVNGTLVVTGSGATISAPVNGEAIVTGDDATMTSPINGGFILAGSGANISGNLNCGGLITGSNETITGIVNGPLIVVGNNVTIGQSGHTGNVNGELVMIGNNTTVFDNVNNTIIATGVSEVVDGTVNANAEEYNNDLTINGTDNGTVTAISGTQTFAISGSCLGTVNLTVAPNSTGSPSVSISFSSASISG